MNIPGYGPQAPSEAMQSGVDDGADVADAQAIQGDGLQHHEIHEMPDGSVHSTHTDAEGNVEETDHDSYEDACAACAGEDAGADEDTGDDGDTSFADDGGSSGAPNIAASYGSSSRKA